VYSVKRVIRLAPPSGNGDLVIAPQVTGVNLASEPIHSDLRPFGTSPCKRIPPARTHVSENCSAAERATSDRGRNEIFDKRWDCPGGLGVGVRGSESRPWGHLGNPSSSFPIPVECH
jgi:hypothetical protein